MSVPMQNTVVSTDTDACSGLQCLPSLNLISDGIVGIQVLICVRATKKSQVHRDSDPNSEFLVSVLEKVSGY